MNPVVVIGINHHNTLGVIRALGRAGLKDFIFVILVGGDGFVSKSKYVKRTQLYIIPSDNEIYATLCSLHIQKKGVVICCSDSSIATIDGYRETLSHKFIIPGIKNKQGAVAAFMDKERQIEFAKNVGLNIPDSKVYTASSSLELCPWDVYPCIIKPIDSVTGSKSDIRVCESKNDYFKQLNRLDGRVIIVQKLITKIAEYQLIGCSLNNGEEIIIPGFTHILRQPDNTNTGFLEYCPFTEDVDMLDTLNKGRKFIKELGYSGLFSLEFIRGDDGRDYFLEINMRNDGNGISVTDAGCNLPYIWYAGNMNISDEKTSERSIRRILVMPEFDDFVLVLKRKVSFLQWLKDIKRSDSFMDYSRDDKKPFYSRLLSFISFLFKYSIKIIWSSFKRLLHF